MPHQQHSTFHFTKSASAASSVAGTRSTTQYLPKKDPPIPNELHAFFAFRVDPKEVARPQYCIYALNGIYYTHGLFKVWGRMRNLVESAEAHVAVVRARLPSRFPERVIDAIAAGVKQQVQAFTATATPASAE